MMIRNRDIKNGMRTMPARAAALVLALVLTAALAAAFASLGSVRVSAAAAEAEEPIRVVHKVDVEGTKYCFFVTHNVVLTPAEVAEMTDEELSAEILDRAGLYVKEANCTKKSHKSISPDGWSKSGGSLFLSGDDISEIRLAEPVDGSPVKFPMDLLISTEVPPEEPADEDDPDTEDAVPVYSTFQRTSPKLVFAVVATEEDAAYGEEICTEDIQKLKKQKAPSMTLPKVGSDKDKLPEFRTIPMVDRSRGPLEDTLKDGDPVSLKWIEPSAFPDDEDSSFFDRIPGGKIGFAAIVMLAAAGIIYAIVAIKRRNEEE